MDNYGKDKAPKRGELVQGPITYELTEEEIRAIKEGATTVSPKRVRDGRGGFAIRNHAFSDDTVTIYRE